MRDDFKSFHAEAVLKRVRKRSKPVTRVKLMLDSGAFSAWNQGVKLDLHDYMDFVGEFDGRLFSHVVMDVLPFGPAAQRSIDAIEECAAASFKNLQIMKKAGLAPIPVFHQGERFYWLEKLVGEGERYIGLATRKDLWTKAQRSWLDKCFNLLTDVRGAPLVRTHGFGVTKYDLLTRYPWYTVDSTTWALFTGYGKILVPPRGVDGTPDYARRPIGVITSGEVQGSRSATRQQHDQWAVYGQSMFLDWLIEYLRDYAGVSLAEARHTQRGRRLAGLAYFRGLVASRRHARFRSRAASSLSTPGAMAGLKPIGGHDLHLMYATLLNHQFSIDLTHMEAWTRLLSYFELRNKPRDVIDYYLTTGMQQGYVPRTDFRNWNTGAYKNYRAMALLRRLAEYDKIERTGGDA